MQHENDFQVLVSDENGLIFILEQKEGEVKSPFLLYDGGNHATFYRRPNQVILLDYLNPNIQSILADAKFVVIMEMNNAKDDIILDYKVNIKHVKNNPITDGLK